MRKLGFLILLLVATFLSLSTSYSAPNPNIEGKWSVTGKMSTGVAYTGSVTIKKKLVGYSVAGAYYLASPETERIASFSSKGKFDGKVLTFSFYISKIPGVLAVLNEIGRASNFSSSSKIYVNGKFDLAANGNTFNGTWKSSKAGGAFNGSEKWERVPTAMTVTSLDPKEVESGTAIDKPFTITGTNLPEKDDLKNEDISFLNNGKKDDKISVKEILETNDGHTSLKVRLSIEKDVAAGTRDVQVKHGLGKALLTIKKGAKKLPLGGSVTAQPGDVVKIFVPQKGGLLQISGAKAKLRNGSASGEEVKADASGKFEIAKGGWYYLDLSTAGVSASYSLSSTYRIEARTPEEKTPWNFWYYPFAERWSATQNLYSDGGTYEKLDKLLKIKEDPEGWKKFNPYNHMDNDVKDSKIKALADKYYKNFKWTEPTDTADKDLLKKHNPSTIKGYGWSYQRSTDSKKSWWGHCWGAVVASSLWGQPKAQTITIDGGQKLDFSEEEAEGIIVSYYTNHPVYPTNYLRNCPAGRPTDKKDEDVDRYCDDFFLGLMEGIKEKGLPLASNLRAEATDDDSKDQVWNHVIWKFEAQLKEVDGDETCIEIQLKVYATNDCFPSGSSASPRTEDYTMRLKYNQDGSVDRDDMSFQNWISATHYCPSYLWRINSSSGANETENAVLRGKINELVKAFGYKEIK